MDFLFQRGLLPRVLQLTMKRLIRHENPAGRKEPGRARQGKIMNCPEI